MWTSGGQEMLLFDWDDENSSHIAAHAVSCAEAEQVIKNEPFDLELQAVKGEERFAQLGKRTLAGFWSSCPHRVRP
jgi:uncharacterized DUF497 family protein